MKILIIGLACALTTTLASAAPEEEGVSYVDQTTRIDRFRYLETLDVTAEKQQVNENAREPLSRESEDILEDLEALENDNR